MWGYVTADWRIQIRTQNLNSHNLCASGWKYWFKIHHNTCQRLQISGVFFLFFGWGGGSWDEKCTIQQSGYIPGPKLYIWHHEWKPLKYFSLRLYIQTLSLTLNSKIFKHPPCTVLLFFMPFVIQMWCLMPGACSLSEPCMSLKLTWLKPLLEER